MCGINGIVYKNKKPNKLEIHIMNQAIKHRGPDDEGIMSFENSILGHVDYQSWISLQKVSSR